MSESYQEYKEERKKLRSSINNKSRRIEDALKECLEQFASDEGETLINVEQFGKLPLGERYYVNEGVYFIPIEYGVKKWLFLAVIEPGFFFGFHDHNAPETCKVICGILVDGKTGKEYLPGEFAYWPTGTIHKPGAKLGENTLELLVIFDIEHLELPKNLTPAN